MLAGRIRGVVSLGTLIAVAACGGGGGDTTGPTGPSAVDIVSGNGQVQLIGTALTLPLVVRVTANGTPAPGKTVTFAVATGTATVSPGSAITDASGQAKTTVTLGSSPGEVSITASVSGTSLKATFVETAGASSITAACASGAATSLTLGEVRPLSTGTGICLSGGAEYGLIAFYANTDSSAVASIGVTAKGAVGVVTASQSPNFNSAAIEGVSAPRGNSFQLAFEGRMRESARLELTPKIAGAQRWYRQRASLATIPANPTVGTFVTLNANGLQNCTSPINITARVAAVSTKAIVVADTANPAGGFTDAEYGTFATMFDTLISPLDIQNFGQPSDIDGNGKVIIFFTKEVNKLTPRGSSGFIGGFFYERDLFPTQSTADLQGCPSSNVAEMYYSLVPDPTGKFSDARSKTGVQSLTPGTLAHEFQHLINAGRRLYVNDAPVFEDKWLDEGLAHIAEELLYYRVAGLAPRQNIGPSTISANAASVDAFNNYQGDNIGRFELFIGKPSLTSAYAGNDSLETRGATWYLLRFLADHRGATDADTWTRLVNTKLAGQHNLADVFGSNYMSQIRDWATSIFADDNTGVTDSRYLESSWNLRAIFPRLVNSSNQPLGIYPLKVIPISDAAGANVSIFGGAEAYFRFSVPTNGSGSIDWSSSGLPTSPLVQFTVVRTK